jgi:hypothetical protein
VLLSRALTRRGDLKGAEEALAGLRAAEAEIQAGVIEMRKGQWGKALALFEAALGKKNAERLDAAKFWRGWCLRSMGRPSEAAAAWREIVGGSSFGKKAAACLLAGDIKTWLSESARLWPRTETLPDSTECGAPGGFDPVMSIQALVEFQLPDGSFADHCFGPLWALSYAAFASSSSPTAMRSKPPKEPKTPSCGGRLRALCARPCSRQWKETARFSTTTCTAGPTVRPWPCASFRSVRRS